MYRLVLFIASLLTLTGAVSAQGPVAGKPSPTNALAPVNTPLGAERAALELHAQNQLLKEYQANLLNTVYWSLGTLLVIAGLLLGFGWFANFRVYDRDKVALQRELEAEISKEIGKALAAIGERAAQLEREIGQANSETQQRLMQRAQAAANRVGETTKDLFSRSERDIWSLKLRTSTLEADQWAAKGVRANEISVLLDVIEAARQLGWGHKISDALDRINEALRTRPRVNAQLATDLYASLDRLEPAYAVPVHAVKQALLQLKGGGGTA